MEVLFFYTCPACGRHTGLPSPTEPRMITCLGCRANFPIIPVDQHALQYMRIMLAQGMAAADPDYM